tara:strand:- start:6551 stop:8248 length:1698 start_codon:yes stop_codon:yes gene_type:complete
MSTRAFEELLSSSPFAIIELFELQLFQELHNDDHRYYFHAGTNRKTDVPTGNDDPVNAYSIKYGGIDYQPLPIEASGFEYKGDGALPRPSIRISNLQSRITGLLLGINQVTPGNDLNGAQVKRIRTLSRFLDSDNWQNGQNPYGNSDASTSAQLPQEIYYIDRKVVENREFVEFELVSSLDLNGVKVPRRLAMQNLCQWEYRSKECGYAGANEFTVEGTAIASVAGSNFGYSSNADILAQNVDLRSDEGGELISPNGWYKLTITNVGNLVLKNKADETLWQTTSGPGTNTNGYALYVAADGNIIIHNRDLARTDYENGSAFWVSNTFRLGALSALNRYTINGGQQWWPDDVEVGRSGGFTWELVGSSPTAANQTTTVSRTFNDTDPITGGARSVNITFNLRSYQLPAGTSHYTHGNPNWTGFVWGDVQSTSINSSTGFWRHNEDYIAKVSLSSGNPHRDNHPTEGTLTEAGMYFIIQSTGWNDMRLRIRDTGILELERTDSSYVVWNSGNPPTTAEPTVVSGTTTSVNVSGMCGKRVSDCRLRFPTGDANGGLPFGSFPALGLNN